MGGEVFWVVVVGGCGGGAGGLKIVMTSLRVTASLIFGTVLLTSGGSVGLPGWSGIVEWLFGFHFGVILLISLAASLMQSCGWGHLEGFTLFFGGEIGLLFKGFVVDGLDVSRMVITLTIFTGCKYCKQA